MIFKSNDLDPAKKVEIIRAEERARKSHRELMEKAEKLLEFCEKYPEFGKLFRKQKDPLN